MVSSFNFAFLADPRQQWRIMEMSSSAANHAISVYRNRSILTARLIKNRFSSIYLTTGFILRMHGIRRESKTVISAGLGFGGARKSKGGATVRKRDQCPCGSELAYTACCEKYHLGSEIEPTAEALIRARQEAEAGLICPMDAVNDITDYITHPNAAVKQSSQCRRDLHSRNTLASYYLLLRPPVALLCYDF